MRATTMKLSPDILVLVEREKTVAEGAGTAGLAAFLTGKADLRAQKVGTLISVGNVDVNLLARIIERGLVSIAGSKPTAFQAVSFEPSAPHENREDGGIQTQCARGLRPEVSHDPVHKVSEEGAAWSAGGACA
jgi:hypothetical protein